MGFLKTRIYMYLSILPSPSALLPETCGKLLLCVRISRAANPSDLTGYCDMIIGIGRERTC